MSMCLDVYVCIYVLHIICIYAALTAACGILQVRMLLLCADAPPPDSDRSVCTLGPHAHKQNDRVLGGQGLQGGQGGQGGARGGGDDSGEAGWRGEELGAVLVAAFAEIEAAARAVLQGEELTMKELRCVCVCVSE